MNIQFEWEVIRWNINSFKSVSLHFMHQRMYSYMYGLAVRYFLKDAGGKQIIHYIYLKWYDIINHKLSFSEEIFQIFKFLNLNLFLQRIFYFFLALLLRVIKKRLKMAKTVQPSTSINYLQYHLFSKSWKEKEAVPESPPVSARCPSGKLAYLQGLYLENNVIHRLLVHELFICNFINRTGKKFKKLNMLYKHKC